MQAYCDVLEEKWILSETAGTDVGLQSAVDAYIGLGAPAPEADGAASGVPSGGRTGLDIDWSTGWETDGVDDVVDDTEPGDRVPG